MRGVGHLQHGEVFAGFYRVVRLIKAGGMGAVYEVRHTHTNKRHALKVMLPEIVANPDARRRFEKEAQVAAIIDFPAGVVDVAHAGIDEATGMPFLVMEFLVGYELGEFIQSRRRIEPASLVKIFGQIAKALDRAHDAGVVHRDLKPENLFVVIRDDEPPAVKILDFGIAKILAAGTVRSTMAGGTPLYMAPEQTKRTAQIGPATDIWALGLIAYTALVGRTYWEAEDVHSLYGEILDGNYEPASSRASRAGVTLPAAFDAFFAGCVVKDPARRFRSARDASTALAAAFTPTAHIATVPWTPPTTMEGGVRPTPDRRPPPVPPAARRSTETPTPPRLTSDTAAPATSTSRAPMPDWQSMAIRTAAAVLAVGFITYGTNAFYEAFYEQTRQQQSTTPVPASREEPIVKASAVTSAAVIEPIDDTPDARGPLDGKSVETVVATKRVEVRKSCYEPWAEKGPAAVKVTLKIAPDGRVTSSEIATNSGEKAVATCVQLKAKSWRFPLSEAGGTFNVPFLFGS